MTHHEASTLGRRVEDWGMLAAIVVAIVAALARVAVNTYCSVRLCPVYRPGFPWEVWMLMGMLVLPKVIGRATAGKVWLALATRGRRITGVNKAPEDAP